MITKKSCSGLLIAFITSNLAMTSIAYAQESSVSKPAAASSAMSKQDAKAQRKAERKARREKKNAELKQLEKNGYNPSGTQTQYPQNYQDAQKKTDAQKNRAKPASAP